MQIKVDTYTAGDKSWVRVVDQHSGIGNEVTCTTATVKLMKKELIKWVKKQVKEKYE